MSIVSSPSSRANQDRRLSIKTLGSRMQEVAVRGAGLSQWEAKILVDMINEVYFSDPNLKALENGQMRYTCVAASEGAGKPLDKCKLVTVSLTMISDEDESSLPGDGKKASVVRRQRKLARIADEAAEQHGYLTQEDLSKLLYCDTRTVRRDIAELKNIGIVIPTRGQQKDIGPGVSHRSLVIRQWLEGKEPYDIANHTKHSMGAVENYLEKFKRVAWLQTNKHFDAYQIALTVGISVHATNVYLELCKEFKGKSFFKSRMQEMEQTGSAFYRAQDEKKEQVLSQPMKKGCQTL